MNLAHYRNRADFELNLHIHISGAARFHHVKHERRRFTSVNPNGLLMGSQVGHFWVKQEALRCCRSSPPRLSQNRRTQRRSDARAGSQNGRAFRRQPNCRKRSARNLAETSALDTIVGNAEAAIIKCLGGLRCLKVVTSVQIEYKLNRQYFDRYVDPQIIIAGIQLYDRGLVARADMVNAAKLAKIVEAG